MRHVLLAGLLLAIAAFAVPELKKSTPIPQTSPLMSACAAVATNPAALSDLLEKADKTQKTAWGRQLLQDTNTQFAYLGANLLIGEGRAGECMPVLAKIVLDGRADRDLKGRLGYDWVQIEPPSAGTKLFLELADEIIRQYPTAPAAQQTNAIRFCRGLGIRQDPFNPEKAHAQISTMLLQLQKTP